ncbi:CNH domain-containing protein [Radiomyces spectabilis]|uniref:CNH domain-containing protein n=1 Tax=Radiomyces spectabilis TaxID=64574 RepID=UPI00221FCB98|nr:CNH domain-containing protein [Radiomyces spectabilis]KAI8381366.1 CNH domain-containing protein [Radiomyces spectabilis]
MNFFQDNLKQSQAPSLQEKEETHRLWVHSVSPETVEATPNAEIKRQECIYELIYTEEDFVKDLQYVHNFWVKPLVTSDVIPSERREYFVQEVFWNMADIEKVNAGLSKALIERQKENELVHSIGDVILKYVCQFDPFVVYGAHQVIGKFNFELEKKRNPKFSQFVEETERKPESRRLELNGYLTKPTTRLGRYNLLLREILKRTPEGNPDRETLPQVMELITRFLVQVNTETGKCENLFSLQQIHERLYFKPPIDHVDLSLLDPQRQLLLKGRMKRKGNSSSDASDLQAFLFDHYLVFAKIKYDNHLEYYRVYRKPIPIELLSISVSGNNRAKRASAILQYSRSATLTSPTPTSVRPSVSDTHQSKPGNLGITFYHHGRRGSPPITLYPSNASSRKLWIEKIAEQQQLFAQKKSVFTVVPMVQAHFMIANRVHNTVTLDDEQNGKRLLVGTDQGVYICKGPNYETVSRFLPLEKVSQIEVVNQAQLLVLADKTLLTFPLDMLTSEAYSPVKRGRAVSQNTAFFHVGECMGRTLVCVVKNNTLSQTTIRVLEPEMTEEGKKSKSMFNLKRLVKSGSVALKPYKDLYLPSEASGIQLLKTKICISSPREIGVIDMKHFGVQALLDPADEELSFVFSRTDVRPITIYRVRFAEYFVCYNEFAFFVDQRGRLIRSSVRIDWEGAPDAFAFSYPYIVAFEPDFIEVRNITNGSLEQLIRGSNIRCTNSSPGTIQGTMNDPENEGFQLLFQLDLHT